MLLAPSLPTPLVCREIAGAAVWLKDDGASHPTYGGNKVRKAERIVAEAKRRGARRLVTIGAAGSHHVLTLGLFARAAGLDCAAVLFPQPRTEHVAETLRASLGQGVQARAVPHPALVPLAVAATLRPGDYLVPPGGSSVVGSLAYADAVDELAEQLDREGLDPPEHIVVAVGSGGTAAGIAAGVLRRRWPTRVLGVQVVPGRAPGWHCGRLTRALLRRLEVPAERLGEVLLLDRSQVGAGYGHATAAGDDATRLAATAGLTLDATYTAKAFAGLLAHLRSRGSAGRPIVYWHTLSSAPLGPLLDGAPTERELPPRLRATLGA